jgi:outer membrane protein
MTHSTLRLALTGAAAACLLASSGAAFAQPAAKPVARPAPAAVAPAAEAPLPQGPAVPGVCVFNQDATFAQSAVGKYAGQRLQQLATQAKAELEASATALDTDAKALDAARTTITQDAYQQRMLALQQRSQAGQRLGEQRSRELQLTQQKALARISTEVNPLLRQLYVQHNCSLLLNAQALFTASPNMDLTNEVVRLLDAKITQFPFEREHLDQAQAAPTAGK